MDPSHIPALVAHALQQRQLAVSLAARAIQEMERLEQIWNEQEAMICALFAENSNGEGNAGL